MHLYFASFLNTETWQIVEIYSQGRQEYPSTMQAVNIMAADDLGRKSLPETILIQIYVTISHF